MPPPNVIGALRYSSAACSASRRRGWVGSGSGTTEIDDGGVGAAGFGCAAFAVCGGKIATFFSSLDYRIAIGALPCDESRTTFVQLQGWKGDSSIPR